MTTGATVFQHQSDPTRATNAFSGLTPDLLERARGRVRIVAWLMLAMMAVGAPVDIVIARITEGRFDPVLLVGAVIGVLAGAGLLAAAYNRQISHKTVLYLALGFEVALCLLMALMVPWMISGEAAQLPYITWVTPIIIFFPLVVPSPPRLTLATALAAAATRPLSIVLLDAAGTIQADVMTYVTSVLSPVFAVAIAYAGSRIIYGMNVDLAEAQRMGSYTLETKLGSGGMGEVWRARHRLLARPAAVKLIRPESMGRDAERQRVTLSRFEREAQATAALQSHHTIQLYDFGIADSGTFYYVMELLRGLDLDALVTRFGPLVPERAVHLLLQVCESLGEAHEAGLIHRDLKPATIYVCRHARRVDFVKVLDFGLVKFSDQDDEAGLKLTAEDSVGGTPAFMAPEQATGQTVDARTDIYQLGCVAYWLLTGVYVFQADTVMATMMMHVQATPQLRSTRTEQLIPQALDDAVLTCLEKDPARRPQAADDLARMLTAANGAGVWSEKRAGQWWETYLPDR